ncbi:MAG: hypothetical protein OSJ61_13860 [Lachnospiraceae bacterium]|nr:hypothetical protein [Lachnospiraceae bacterium]
MINPNLQFKVLPAQLLISNYVKGYKKYTYEIYLRDFINASEFFLRKSNHEVYVAPESEEKGQCDCISTNYQLDFKLLLPETMGQAKREFSPSITQFTGGVVCYGIANKTSQDKDYKEIKATYLHVAFRILNYEKLCEIEKMKYKQRGIERDVNLILKELKKPKNLMFMIPYEFSFDGDMLYENGKKEIISAISSDYVNLIKFRENMQPLYETYVAFIYHSKIIFLQVIGNKFIFVDEVDLFKSKLYQELLNFSPF